MAARRRAARRSLTAAGVAAAPTLATLDLSRMSTAERYFYAQALGDGIANYSGDAWPHDGQALDVTEAVFRDGGSAVFVAEDGTIALVSLDHGWFGVRAASHDPAAVAQTIGAFRAAYPASYLMADDSRVPITFWTCGPMGATARLRRIDASPWADVADNYSATVRGELAELMAWRQPSGDGQLLLWQGAPGCGKSWALRALASEWHSWAEFCYITDPDVFFVEKPSYMIDVLLSDSYETIYEPTGDVVTEAGEKWRVLILEDTGELLSANAKEKYGQGLSRLLNVVDGMIGQGLRVLALITTNDELGELAPAATRPGRCASQLVFGPLSDEEAQAWTGDAAATGGTLAELYSRYGRASVEALTESDAPDDEPDVRAEVARVAALHQPDEPGYGQTAWDESTRTVLWVGWDGTSVEEAAAAEEAFLAVPGVEAFSWEAEALPTGWFDAEVVYPDDPPRWVIDPPSDEAGIDRVVALALAPLTVDAERAPDPVLASVSAPSEADLVAREALERSDRLAASAVEALGRLAGKEQPAPTFHIHLPQHQLGVTVERQDVHVPVTVEPAHVTPTSVEIHVPEQAAPVVHVAAAEPVHVDVHVPEQPAPRVDVHVPAAPAPRAVRVEFDADGNKVFVPVEVAA